MSKMINEISYERYRYLVFSETGAFFTDIFASEEAITDLASKKPNLIVFLPEDSLLIPKWG